MSEVERPNFGELVEAAQRMQQEVQRVQQELAGQTVEGSAGGGLVVVRANGRNQVLSVAIDPQVLGVGELAMLQDLIVAATNQALARAAELAQQALTRVAGGLPLRLPGLL
ncbi:MAG: YbaB/EbfC family nucleoid-associated protein [Proteobacteria bacterium]|nr:YbaB/EbfC family nucleoid-associated protein [Pseudomonadota bacterium]